MARRMSIGSSLLSESTEEENISPSFNKIAVRRSIGGGRKSIGSSRRRSFGSPLVANVDPDVNASPNQEAIRKMYSKINDVIQLSTENKITQKNAWNLGVNVDSILESALDEGIVEEKEKSQKNGEVVMRRRRSGGFACAGVNFQKASCKLDASVKIYSVRVDDTHASSYRILENLTRNSQETEHTAKPPSRVGDKASSNKFGVANTLEKNPDSLNCANNQDLNVDPSFHKMSHLFDEGGASGMLLYNLNLEPTSGCRIAFGDSVSAEFERNQDTGGKTIIDITSLQSRVERAVTEVGCPTELCVQLSEFRSEILTSGYSEDKSTSASLSTQDQDAEAEIFLAQSEERDEEDDYLMGGDGEGLDDSFDDDNGMPFGFSSPTNEGDTGVSHSLDLFTDNEYAFFDMSRLSASNTWAGSSHWMFRKRRAQETTKVPSETMEVDSNGPPKSKARKGALSIDFLLNVAEGSPRLLIPVQKKRGGKTPPGSTIELTGAAISKTMKTSFLLPEDAGLQPSDLARLFLRPHKQMKRFIPSSSFTSSPLNLHHDAPCDDDSFCENDTGETYGEQFVGKFVPFDMDADVDASRMLAPERAVAKISVKHEVRAKRVDVRELKHQIWNDIRPICEPQAEVEIEDCKAFSDVMASVGEKNNQHGVTLPFYFICVLHLANEKGLKLEGTPGLSDFVISSD